MGGPPDPPIATVHLQRTLCPSPLPTIDLSEVTANSATWVRSPAASVRHERAAASPDGSPGSSTGPVTLVVIGVGVLAAVVLTVMAVVAAWERIYGDSSSPSSTACTGCGGRRAPAPPVWFLVGRLVLTWIAPGDVKEGAAVREACVASSLWNDVGTTAVDDWSSG